MTELHNMSVPPLSVVSVRRANVVGRRYRITTDVFATGKSAKSKDTLLRCFREDGIACALALMRSTTRLTIEALHCSIEQVRLEANASAALRVTCDAALERLQLPPGYGFFVDEEPQRADHGLTCAAAIALLAARSGRLYLPGRFEPSLIVPCDVTLWFPYPQAEDRHIPETRGAL